MEQSDLRKLQVEKTPGTRKGNMSIDCIWEKFQEAEDCPKRLASFGYSTLASEEKASKK